MATATFSSMCRHIGRVGKLSVRSQKTQRGTSFCFRCVLTHHQLITCLFAFKSIIYSSMFTRPSIHEIKFTINSRDHSVYFVSGAAGRSVAGLGRKNFQSGQTRFDEMVRGPQCRLAFKQSSDSIAAAFSRSDSVLSRMGCTSKSYGERTTREI